MWPVDEISRLESAQVLDRPATAVRTVVRRVLANRAVKDALHGVWLGHPLHPGAAQFTAGSFLSASVLDALRGGRRESSTLIATGLAATLPTVSSGWADWADGHEDQQRVGLVHAAPTAPRSRSTPPRCWPAAGATTAARCRWRPAWSSASARCSAGTWASGRRWAPTTRRTWRTPAPSSGSRSARCPHLSGSLSDGELGGSGAQTTVVCPWHGSEFRVDDGCVVHGPATAPVPRFETRVTGGTVQARVVTIAGVMAS